MSWVYMWDKTFKIVVEQKSEINLRCPLNFTCQCYSSQIKVKSDLKLGSFSTAVIVSNVA